MQYGGTFMVPPNKDGATGSDSVTAMLSLTPGEEVSVTPVGGASRTMPGYGVGPNPEWGQPGGYNLPYWPAIPGLPGRGDSGGGPSPVGPYGSDTRGVKPRPGARRLFDSSGQPAVGSGREDNGGSNWTVTGGGDAPGYWNAGGGGGGEDRMPLPQPTPLGGGDQPGGAGGSLSVVHVNVFGAGNPTQFLQSRLAIQRAMRLG
jgi:hypothetical protein